jgi:hypothetical protein
VLGSAGTGPVELTGPPGGPVPSASPWGVVPEAVGKNADDSGTASAVGWPRPRTEVSRMSVLSTAQPLPALRRDGFPFSALVWLGLVAYVALAKALVGTWLAHRGRGRGPARARRAAHGRAARPRLQVADRTQAVIRAREAGLG